jgi:hypothetical protein
VRAVVLSLLVAGCYRENAVTPCTLTCNDSPCPSGLTCGSDFICQTPGSPICSMQQGDGGLDGSIGGTQIYVKAPNPDQDDLFGTSVALTVDGRWLAVGAPGEASGSNSQTDNSLPGAGAVYVFRWNGTTYEFESYLKNPFPDQDDKFGTSVAFAANGNVLVVGAPLEDGDGTDSIGNPSNNSRTDSGAVFIFKRNGPLAPWMWMGYLKAPTSIATARFGTSVAVSEDGNVIAAGAPGEAHAYQYFLSTQTGYLTPAMYGAITDHIGGSVALARDGNTLLAGGELEDGPGTGFTGDPSFDTAIDAGAAYLMTQNSAQRRYAKASNTEAGDQFGIAVASDAMMDVFAVGAIAEDSNARGVDGIQTNNGVQDSGAVYVFSRTGLASWVQSTYLKAPNSESQDHFGRSVALASDGAFLVVGAPGESSSNTALRAGAAYVFEKTTSGWTVGPYLKALNAETDDELGTSVAISDDHAVIAVGAPLENSASSDPNNNGAKDAGAVYVFR